jgi:hypothetical protein
MGVTVPFGFITACSTFNPPKPTIVADRTILHHDCGDQRKAGGFHMILLRATAPAENFVLSSNC